MKKVTSILGAFLVILCMTATGQDTELYVSQTNNQNSRPKVLIIFDNSGSMGTLVGAYDSSITYPSKGDIESGRIYWSTDENGEPEPTNSTQYFLESSNRCASSIENFNTFGASQNYIRAWRGNRWRNLSDDVDTRDSDYIECYRDSFFGNASNPGTPVIADGFPRNNNGPYVTNNNPRTYHPFDGTDLRFIFTANYMNWFYNPDRSTVTRLDVAKDVVTNIINSNPNVDFGLEIFNRNAGINGEDEPPHGGKIVSKINKNMTIAQRADLTTLVNDLSPLTWTPLCESMYEAYRYFKGLNVGYGNDEPGVSPNRDLNAEQNGTYLSPLGDCQEIYVILMTDGIPTNDTDADNDIAALSGIGNFEGNRLDELAGWLYDNDLDGDSSNGIQRVVTYTIGFQTDQALLKSAATKGGGEYYIADNAVKLQQAFQGALNAIIETSTSFTAPSVAVNSFNRSRSMDEIYMSMFRPNSGSRWSGNLKKLTLNNSGTLVDANGQPAMDSSTGNILDTAQTLWSTTADGGEVTAGGAGALLAARTPSSRVIKTNTGTGGSLENFDKDNSNLLYSDFSVADDAEKIILINWARGSDVDDENQDSDTTDTRSWILGDPLHSRPLVINYGARGTYTKSNPDVRILMGTNHGVLHMFGGDNGEEDWAFMPKELLSLTKIVRENKTSVEHQYGIDGSVISYVIDYNNNGSIDSNDKVYIYFGLRRGGSAYYAMDISDPDNPKYMWRFDKSSSGFSELGQSWSKPLIKKIPGITDPVMIISGGYDTNKDASTVGTDDSVGRGIFIVNAKTGTLIWSVTPAANSAKNLQETGLLDSIPASIATIDSNGDRLVDRLYVGDTGGNVWRVDMPGNVLPTAAQNTWSIFKIASLGGTADDDDRRFFSKIDVASTRTVKHVPFDALLLGSGNRAHPNETKVDNNFYMIRDTEINSSYHGLGENDTAIPSIILQADLYDATSNVLQDGSTGLTDLLSKNGWRISLEDQGEKSLSSSVTLNGTVFFTTFTPDASTAICLPVPGKGSLYAVSLHRATAVYNWDESDPDLTKQDRKKEKICNCLPETPPPHFGDDGKIRIIVNEGDGKGTFDTKGNIGTKGTYWYEEKK